MMAAERGSRIRGAGWLLTAGILAAAVRTLGAEQVFRDEGIVLRGFDSYYHLRRAFHTVLHFPEVLARDEFLNFPFGSAVPWPPLYDFALAATTLLFGGGEAVLERVGAIAPVALSALAVIPTFLIGSRLGGRGVGIAAAFGVALLDAAVRAGRVGYADHHAMTALLGACLLAASVGWLAAREETDSLVRRTAALGLTRIALVLTWPGSVMLLVVSEGGLLAATALEPDAPARRRLVVQGAISTGLCAALLLPLAWTAATTADYGPSPSYFTTFHPLFFAVLAALYSALAVAGRAGARLEDRAVLRLAVAFGLGAILALGLVATLPGLREGIEYALRFLSGTHSAGGRVLEEQPLFATGGPAPLAPSSLFGFALYALPLVPIALGPLVVDRRTRPQAALFGLWFGVFAVLSLTAIRWVHEFAVAAAVGLALLGAALWQARRVAALPLGVRTLAALAIAIGLFLPTLRVHVDRANASLRVLAGEPPAPSVELVMTRFARDVRSATPETRGFVDPSAEPEYGVFTWSGLGHVLHWAGRRATPADNFGPVIGLDDENFLLSTALFTLRDVDRALSELERLKTPYIVSADLGWESGTVGARLHYEDGTATDRGPALDRLRLVVESPSRPRGGLAYKLFAVVEGARLELAGRPAERVEARVRVRTNTGREFEWLTRTHVDPMGQVSLRLPYATRSETTPTRALGPYRLRSGDRSFSVTTSEEDVLEGRLVGADGGAARSEP